MDTYTVHFNDEADVNIHDRAFASHMDAAFADDFARSRPVTLAQWQARPWQTQLMDWFWSLSAMEI